MTVTDYLGKPTSRVEGHAKVTGAAKYAAEHKPHGLAYGFVITSAIARGRIKRIHTADAMAVPGVLDVFTHAHRPELASADGKYGDEVAPPGSPRLSESITSNEVTSRISKRIAAGRVQSAKVVKAIPISAAVPPELSIDRRPG